MAKLAEHRLDYLRKQTVFLVNQYPDLSLKDYKKMLRHKAGKGIDFDFETEYKNYLEIHKNDSVQ